MYFVAWWLTSSVMWVNLFVALILEVCRLFAVNNSRLSIFTLFLIFLFQKGNKYIIVIFV